MNLDKTETKLLQALVRREIILMETAGDYFDATEISSQRRQIYFQLKNMDSRLDRVARGKLAQERKAAR